LGSNINFNNYFEQNVYYQATVNVDGLSATSERFNLKLKKEQNLFFSVSDVKKIVKELRENTFFTDKGKKYPLTQLPYYSIDKIFHRNDKSGKYSSEVVTNNSFENFTTQLNKIFDKYEINNPRRIRHFLSQIFIETQYFSQTIETDNSYTHNYDPLRGRGFIHLTTKGNYKKYTKYKQEVDKLNIDFEINYSLLSTNLEYSADCSGWYWKFGREKDLNVLADTYSVEKLTPWINAASLNLEERKNAYQLLEKIIV
jgi:predicted chitinase